MLDRLQTISANLKTTDDLLKLALSDLTAGTTAFPTRNGEGPSILWQVEHMMGSRAHILSLLRATLPEAPSKAQAAPAELLDAWTAQAGRLHETLEHCPADLLDAETKGGPHGETTVFHRINFLAWHEAYHFGAVGFTRKALGLPEIADLIRTQQQHSAVASALAKATVAA